MTTEFANAPTWAISPAYARQWEGLSSVRAALDQSGKDTLVVIPHRLDSPDRNGWLREAMESVGGWNTHVAVDRYRCGPASAIMRAEQEIGAFPDYVFVLDDDDVALPEAIAKMRVALQASLAPFVCSDFIAERDGVEVVDYPRVRYPTPETLVHGWGHRGLMGYYWPMVCRVGGLDTTLRRYYDYDIARRLAFTYGAPVYLPEKLLRYRLHGDQITKHARANGTGPDELFSWLMSRPRE